MEKWESMLGIMPDTAIAKKFGLSRSKVIHRRYRLGISPAVSDRSPRGWTKEELKLLGTESDERISKKIGVSVTSVSRERRKRGISSYDPTCDNRGDKLSKTRTMDPKIIAAIRRARKAELPNDTIRYIFGELLK